MRVLVGLGLLLSACTERNPDFCASDADCAGTPRPFCDVNGEFAESNGTAHICTPTPADCPVERCGCTPGESLACDVDQLTVCAADGKSTATETCGLGCSTEDRCLTFEPSNGLGPALEMAAAEPDIVLPAGVRIDTALGLVQDANGNTIPVRTIVITQDGGTSIRAFLARSWLFDSATVRGSHAFAVVASTDITIRGTINASAQGIENGPSGQESPAVCVGTSTRIEPENCQFACTAEGAGGGGNATIGGVGGGFNAPGKAGGALIPRFEPLVGGCRGGSLDGNGNAFRAGGGGGGAVQLVSGDRITFADSGLINVGGGGGLSSTGGGSGGVVIVEAPSFRLEGAAAGIVANGGAGGGCGSQGADASITTAVALAPKCIDSSAGNGATASVFPQPGQNKCSLGQTCVADRLQGGGGGAVGRLMIATRNGEFEVVGTPIVSAVVTKLTLSPR